LLDVCFIVFALANNKRHGRKNIKIDVIFDFYSFNFIGRYHYSKSIANEKGILRKMAVLKSIFEEVYEEDLSKNLEHFIEKEQQGLIDTRNIKLHTVLISYFRLNQKSNNRHSIDFLHKSFQEYLLAENYIESILLNKGFRLNIGKPSELTIEFLPGLISMINDPDKKEYEKPLLRIARSLYINIADEIDKGSTYYCKDILNLRAYT
jgi:hypothetical protein